MLHLKNHRIPGGCRCAPTVILCLLTCLSTGSVRADEPIPLDQFLADADASSFDDIYASLEEETELLFEEARADSDDFVFTAQQATQPPASTVPTPPGVSQPGTPAPSPPAATPSPRRLPPSRPPRTRSRRAVRLARVPNMFGDFWGGSPILKFTAPTDANDGAFDGSIDGEAQTPLTFGGRRTKISENNGLLPSHRVYFNYNHYHNANHSVFADPTDPEYDRDLSNVDVWTLGVERPLGDSEDWSVELRMPIYGKVSSGASVFDPINFDLVDYSTSEGGIGNISVIFKNVLYEEDTTVISGGLGITIPTAEDVSIRVRRVTTEFMNQTVDVSPWIGISGTPGDGWFWQLFTQLNIPLNGSAVNYSSGIDPNFVFASDPDAGSLGRFDLQTLFTAEVSAGHWLFRDTASDGINGIALITELHYTTALNDSDVLMGSAGALTGLTGSDIMLMVNQPGYRQHIANATIGLHFTVGENMKVRFGQVFPLRQSYDQPFSTESQAQVEISY